jgi:hypothetical protein
MTMISHKFHPETDDKKHPIMEGNGYIHAIVDDYR